jgi:hypothetical protein
MVMENKVQQEILLMTNSSLSQISFSAKNGAEEKSLSRIEQLEEACWNGLLDQFLPGTLERTESGKKLYLWQIQSAKTFLHLDLCDRPEFSNGQCSIDPYLFLSHIICN